MSTGELVKLREPEPQPGEEGGYKARNAFVARQFNGRILVQGKSLKAPVIGSGRQGLATWYLAPHADPDTVLQDWFVFINQIRVHSGCHIHQGGLCLFILEGKGHTVVEGTRYDWGPGDLVMLPIKPGGVEHQHFQAEPDTSTRWMAFIYTPQHDYVGSGVKQISYSADYKARTGAVDAPDETTPYNPRRDFSGWPLDSFGPEPRKGNGFNGYLELIRLRDNERRRIERAFCVIRGDELAWETNPQGIMQWYLHPALEGPAIRSYLFYRQKIRAGSRSGRQRHQGGQIVYIVDGRGCTDIDGVRYDWEGGDMVQLPLRPDGVVFQHFNRDPQHAAHLVACEPNWVDSLGVDRGSGFVQLENCPEYEG